MTSNSTISRKRSFISTNVPACVCSTRQDRFDRFVSVLVFVPRERYDGAVHAAIGQYLADAYHGRLRRFIRTTPRARWCASTTSSGVPAGIRLKFRAPRSKLP